MLKLRIEEYILNVIGKISFFMLSSEIFLIEIILFFVCCFIREIQMVSKTVSTVFDTSQASKKIIWNTVTQPYNRNHK